METPKSRPLKYLSAYASELAHDFLIENLLIYWQTDGCLIDGQFIDLTVNWFFFCTEDDLLPEHKQELERVSIFNLWPHFVNWILYTYVAPTLLLYSHITLS